ncbi:hypothetical protein QN414_33440, partial [Pseudomonas sp. 5S1]
SLTPMLYNPIHDHIPASVMGCQPDSHIARFGDELLFLHVSFLLSHTLRTDRLASSVFYAATYRMEKFLQWFATIFFVVSTA